MKPVARVQASRRRLLVGGAAAGPVLFATSTRSALAAECRSPSKIFSGNLSQPERTDCTPRNSPEAWLADFSEWPATVSAPTIQVQQNGVGNSWIQTFSGDIPFDSFESDAYPSNPPAARILGPICGGLAPDSSGKFLFGSSFEDEFGNSGTLVKLVPVLVNSGTSPPKCSAGQIDRPVSLWEVLAYPELQPDAVQGEFASIVAAAYLNSLKYPDYPVKPGQVIHMWNDGLKNGYCPTDGCTRPWDKSRIMEYLISTWA